MYNVQTTSGLQLDLVHLPPVSQAHRGLFKFNPLRGCDNFDVVSG